MKKGLSFIIACTMMITSILSLFSGCSINAEATDKMLISEWLYLINQSFGFEGYSTEEPYISSITADDPSFVDVQTAFEYSVLPEGYTNLNLDDELTREFCALTLAGAIDISNNENLTIADYDKLSYPEAVITVVNDEVMSLDNNNKFNPDDNVQYDEAVQAIDKACYVWTHYAFESMIEPELQENVIDLGGIATAYVNENGDFSSDTEYISEQTEWLENNNFTYNASTGLATVSNISEKNITEGSIVTIPASLEYPEGLSLKIEKVDVDENGEYLLQTSQPELEEIYKDGFIVQESRMVNFLNSIIYDGDGNLISGGIYNNGNNLNYNPVNMSTLSIPDPEYQQLVTFEGKKTFTVDLGDGLKVEAVINSNGEISFKATYEDKSGYAPFSKVEKSTLTYSKTFSDFGFDCKVALPYWLNSQRLALNYNVTDKLSFTTSTTTDKGGKVLKKDTDKSIGNTAGAYELRQAMKALSNIKANKPLAAKKTICTVIVPVVTGVSIRVLFSAELTVEGAIEITVKYAGCCAGIEKRARSYTITNLNDGGRKESTSVSGSIKAELTAGISVAACVASINAIDIKANVGIGAEAKGTLNEINQDKVPYGTQLSLPPSGYAVANDLLNDVIDEDGHDILICIDLKIYPILKVTALTSDSALGKLIGEMSWSILDSKSTPIFSAHGELYQLDFKFTECTLQDRVEDGLERGDSFIIEPNDDIIMNISEEKTLLLKQLPETEKKYYTLSDIAVESSNTSAVLVKTEFNNFTKKNEKGFKFFDFWPFNSKKDDDESEDEDKQQKIILTALSSGDAIITVRTRDNLFKSEINVHVNEPEEAANAVIIFKTYAASVALNDTIQLSMTSIPCGKDETSVFWKTDDENVATIDPVTGEIKGVSEGNCTVMAYVPGFEESGVYCLITVTKDYTSINISDYSSVYAKSWIKIDGLPVMILENA